MNLFRQDNCASQMKMSKLSFKKSYKVLEFCSLTHHLTTIDLPYKLLGLWCPLFPKPMFIFVCMNLPICHAIKFTSGKHALLCSVINTTLTVQEHLHAHRVKHVL